jgi:hypothetical protein
MSLAVAAWSTEVLGYPQADGYAMQPAPVFSSFPVAAGPSRYEQDRSLNINVVPIRFLFTQGQLGYFEIFYFRTLNSGLYWFSMPLLTSIGTKTFDVHITDEGFRSRMLGGREKPYLNYWEVSFNLEYILTGDSMVPLPGAIIRSPITIAPDSIFSIASATDIIQASAVI